MKKQRAQDIIRAAMEYEPRAYLPDEGSRTRWDSALRTAAEIERERDQVESELRNQEVNELDIAIAVNDIRRVELGNAFRELEELEDISRATFAREFSGHNDELIEAYEQIAISVIIQQRKQAATIMESAGKTLEDGKAFKENLRDDPLCMLLRATGLNRTHRVLEYDFVEAFSDSVLDFKIRSRNGHVGAALSAQDETHSSELTYRLDALCADLIAQKWTVEERPASCALENVLPRIIAVRPDRTNFPLDKTREIWNGHEAERYAAPFDWDISAWNKSAITVQCIVNFDELDGMTLSRTLTRYDRRVMMACDALKATGNDLLTYTMVYHAMGFAGRPTNTQIEKIRDSMTKLSRTALDINLNPYGQGTGSYGAYHERGHVLAIHEREAYINGKLVANAIEIFERPIPIMFAKHLGQITTISNDLLSTPQNKTEITIGIEDYLLAEIARAKGKRLARLEIHKRDLYEECDLTTKDAQKNAQKYVRTACDHYARRGHIYELRKSDENGKAYRGKWVIDLRPRAK